MTPFTATTANRSGHPGGSSSRRPIAPRTALPRRVLATVLLAAAALTFGHAPARAQIVAIVNGEPITATDIAQRSKLLQLSTHKAPARQEVLDELIDDKLKVQLSKRYIAEVPKREIETAYAGIARRAGLTPQQFNAALKQSGIDVDALKARIHADFVWNQIVRGKFQGSLQVGEKDVAAALQSKNKQEATGYEYVLRPILLLVPKGSSTNILEARKREAESLRARFQNCDEGVRLAMALPDVAVRDTVRRLSADLPGPQREVLNNTPVGHLTPPDTTMTGVELFAVCSKEASSSETPTRREARDELYTERYNALSKKFLKELRAQALIELR